VTAFGEGSGIAKAKMVLNSLHSEMALQGFEEGHVHQENDVSKILLLFCVGLTLCAVYRLASGTACHSEGLPSCCAHGLQQGFQGSWFQYVLIYHRSLQLFDLE
jgi:hypothetical protein